MELKVIVLAGWAGLLFGVTVFAEEPQPPHIVFVTGDDEYRSEITMPLIAKILEAKHGMKCSIAYAKPKPQSKDNIVGLEALKTADLAVFFMRYRALPDDQYQMIMDYVKSGKPAIGLRTTTHAFLYPKEHELADSNDGFGREVFGQKWINHHGHDSSTNVSVIAEQKEHPILRGIAEKFHVRSWLYHVTPLHGKCTELLAGDAVKGEEPSEKTFGTHNPVAWTKTDGDRRVFFTTLGHPQDFENESVRRLLINGIYWALEKDIPEGGTHAEIQGEYVAPPTT